MKKLLLSLSTSLIVVSGAFAQAHVHLYIGATGLNQGDPLTFDNAADYDTNSRFIKTLTYTNASTYAGYYQGNITLAGLAATLANSGPADNHAALGAQLWAQIVSVEGPTGGEFAFWETGATIPTIRLASGTTGTNTFKLSENNGAPGADPYGHYHGRNFTATKPGVYVLAFRAIDKSTNGFGGGPIHTPSQVSKYYFQAGINIASVIKNGPAMDITFGGMSGQTFHVEYSTNLMTGGWTTLGSLGGYEALMTFSDSETNQSRRFYRIKTTVP